MILLVLFAEFFKVGLFCFGGAFGMIPLIEETVINHGWLTETEFYNFIGVCESTPGPIAVNMATYIGSVQGGLPGSIAATLGVVTPSFIIILLIASFLKNLTNNKIFKSFLKGAKPVIVALILSTGVLLVIKAFGYAPSGEFSINLVSVTIFLVLCAIFFVSKYLLKKQPSSITLILISAALGIAVNVLANTL